jgi:VanZ family protein
LFWIALIFLMSTDMGSSEHTSRIIRPILEFLFPSSPPETLDLYQWYIRKLAHFTEYGILGLLATRLFRGSWWILWPVLLVTFVAAMDEWHQSFVGSRTSSPVDVMLDASGGLAAVLAVWLFTSIRRRRAD